LMAQVAGWNVRVRKSGEGSERRNARIIAELHLPYLRQENNYTDWLKSIGAQNTKLISLDKYFGARYNNSYEYQLLSGYGRAVEKGDISPLVGFAEYENTAENIKERLVGIKTSTGITIEGFTTHFVDRVIGHTSDSHPKMRRGVSVEAVRDALKNPLDVGAIRTMGDGDIRQKFYGKQASVVVSIRDKRIIQANPWKGK